MCVIPPPFPRVVDVSSGPDKAISENTLPASKPGHRGRCTVPLHAAEHAAVRTAVRLSYTGKQRGGG